MLRRFLLLGLLALCAPAFGDDALSAAANSAFLAANAAKPGTITRPSGLQYRVLRSGTGKRPGSNDVARIAYAMRLIDGTLVDSTTPVLPASVLVNTISFAGLAEAVPLMHEGDRWQLVIPPNLAFGTKGGANGVVGPNQALVMDVTLVSTAPPVPGQAIPDSPFSVWSNGRENGAAFTLRH
jgi:FKBP-type peptidyl-prolyl cis-trans isomerase